MADQEELYYNYQTKLRHLEEAREDLDRKWKQLEEDKEESHRGCREDRELMEHLMDMWGNCESSQVLCLEFEETVEEEKMELKKREEILGEEKMKIRKEIARCEEDYADEVRRLADCEG